MKWVYNGEVMPLHFHKDMIWLCIANLEKRMEMDADFAANYKLRMEKYVSNGYAQLFSPDEVQQSSPTTWICHILG